MCGMMQHIFTRKDLQIGGLDVQAGEIIDIIDGLTRDRAMANPLKKS